MATTQTAHKTVYQALKAIAAENPQLLVAYQSDLTEIDKSICRRMKPGHEYIWILREHGTEMKPLPTTFVEYALLEANATDFTLDEIRKGFNASIEWLTVKLNHYCNADRRTPAKVYHIKVGKPGEHQITQITPLRAHELNSKTEAAHCLNYLGQMHVEFEEDMKNQTGRGNKLPELQLKNLAERWRLLRQQYPDGDVTTMIAIAKRDIKAIIH